MWSGVQTQTQSIRRGSTEEDILFTAQPPIRPGIMALLSLIKVAMRICFVCEPQKWRKQAGSDRALLEKSILLQQWNYAAQQDLIPQK